jgi:diguanylate cyclase (GGDEF)-like protein
LLTAYRWLAMLNLAALTVSFLALNGWLPQAVMVRVLLALAVVIPTVLLVFLRGAPIGRGQLPLVLLGLCVLAWLALAADRGMFVLDDGAAGTWLMPFAAFLVTVLALIAIEGWRRLQRNPRARVVAAVAALLTLTTALDASAPLLGWPVLGWPALPLGWVGTLMLIASFAMLINQYHRTVYQSLRDAQAAREHLEREREDLEHKVIHDELTGLYTRAHAIGLLESILPAGGACVVFIDIDDFKAWNDNFGHAMGDRVLREVAQAIRGSIRFGDIPARYAGDEFIVVLPGVRLDAGRRVAEAIRRKMTEIRLGKDTAPVTASFGVALGDGAETPAELLDRADRAVYHAKRTGKNRISSRAAQVQVAQERA